MRQVDYGACEMTYRCAIYGLKHFGIPDHPIPSIYCDECGQRKDARTKSGCAPTWLLNGKAPRGWRVEYDAENHTRRDWCPRCK